MKALHHHQHHPYWVKTIVTSGVFACTAALFFMPESTVHLGLANMFVNLVWIWGEEVV